ncbi:MAG TPA: lysine transporter LysE [Firmicutes bacterium]|nr:lysine transporter LysE [Bacillota bacterium]
MAEIFLQSILIGYSGAMMPGSLLTYTLDQSLKHGFKAGLLISSGHILLEFLLVILILFGFGQYLSAAPAQMVIGVLGGILLLFLGGGMIRDSSTGKLTINLQTNPQEKGGNMLMGSAIICATNPYFSLWWAVVGLGLIMKAYNIFGFIGVVLFYGGHIIADFSWYLFISWLVGKTRAFISLKVYKVLIISLGVCLLGFGVGFIINAFRLMKTVA